VTLSRATCVTRLLSGIRSVGLTHVPSTVRRESNRLQGEGKISPPFSTCTDSIC
jgi:hypothetical protein